MLYLRRPYKFIPSFSRDLSELEPYFTVLIDRIPVGGLHNVSSLTLSLDCYLVHER